MESCHDAGILGCLAVVLGLPGAARAGFVTYTDEAAFRAAAGAVQEIDFETLPDGSPSVHGTLITPDFNYTDQGVTFSSPFPVLAVGGSPGFFGLASQIADTTARNWIIADLVTPATAVGIVFPGGTTLSFFDINDDLVGTASFIGAGSSFFLGVVSDTPIGAAIQDRGSSGESMDSFLFTPVPEPATLLLVAVGALGVAIRRRGHRGALCATLMLTSGVLWAGSSALGGGFGVCEGEGCTEPCPAEGACLSDADCAAGMICGPGCAPSGCGCDPITDTWGCTRDCNGVCVPAPIPTLSVWGLIIMGLLLLAVGTICVRRRRCRFAWCFALTFTAVGIAQGANATLRHVVRIPPETLREVGNVGLTPLLNLDYGTFACLELSDTEFVSELEVPEFETYDSLDELLRELAAWTVENLTKDQRDTVASALSDPSRTFADPIVAARAQDMASAIAP